MHRLIALSILIIILLNPSGWAHAALSVSPNPASVGQEVTITGSKPCETVILSFGDGGFKAVIGAGFTETHTYSSAGTYTLEFSTMANCFGTPTPESVSLTVQGTALPTSPSAVALQANPSSVAIVNREQSIRRVSYLFTASSQANIPLISSSGSFKTQGTTLETVSQTISGVLQNGRGKISETVTVHPRVIQRALKLGVSSFTFQRTFSAGENTVSSSVVFRITTGGGTDFQVHRMELYMENGRSAITVNRNRQGLQAWAKIKHAGSGLLQGYWEVDGKVFRYVTLHVVFGKEVIIKSPKAPSLPTLDPGLHRVRLVLTSPQVNVSFPVVLYYVTIREEEKKLSIALISPDDTMELEEPIGRFIWTKADPASLYHIQFMESEQETPIFSAYVKNQKYTLPQPVLSRLFKPGHTYRWKVTGYNNRQVKIAESRFFLFTFKKGPRFFPGQILLVFKNLGKDIKKIDQIKNKYNLKLLEAFPLDSLDLQVFRFETNKDVPGLIKKIQKEPGVLLAQPNFIFKTLVDPMRKLQKLHTILRIEKVHEAYRGNGVLVAVVDTGVDTRHQDLKERVKSSMNFILGGTYKAEIHGTAIAGIIGASLNNFGTAGVAPGVDILALRACQQIKEEGTDGECYSTAIAKALDHAMEKDAQIVNMSFGMDLSDPLLSLAFEKGKQQGVLFLAPVGNNLLQKTISFPAIHPGVLAVGGLTDNGTAYPNDELVKKARVVAPATNIFTTVPGDRHNFLNGTSMATAVVTGILAVTLEKKGKMSLEEIPRYEEDLCDWQSLLLTMPLCDNESEKLGEK
ncbi:MAG: S8 family serine peptidase [Nitrospinota bacterium]